MCCAISSGVDRERGKWSIVQGHDLSSFLEQDEVKIMLRKEVRERTDGFYTLMAHSANNVRSFVLGFPRQECLKCEIPFPCMSN